MIKDDKDQSLVISNPEIEEANGVKSLNKEDTDTVQLLEEPVSDGVIEIR
jgi:hypothetical protein